MIQAVEENGRSRAERVPGGETSNGELVVIMPQALDDEGAMGVENEALVKDGAKIQEGRSFCTGVEVLWREGKEDLMVQEGGSGLTPFPFPRSPPLWRLPPAFFL